MNLSPDDWIRFATNLAVMILGIMAASYCVAMWLDKRRPYFLFGALALVGVVLYMILRIAALPQPPLLSMPFISSASLVLNGFWAICGMAWLVSLLRWQRKVNHIAHKFLDRDEGVNS